MKFLKSAKGNDSNSRLLVFIVVLATLAESFLILYWGRDNIVQASTAAVILFSAQAGSSLIFMYNQKKQELNDLSK